MNRCARRSFNHVGTACRPYPEWRHPGWNRLSAALHLDDFRKFFEDPNGGRDYTPELTEVSEDDIIGCGYDFTRCSIFYTYNGRRLPDAFTFAVSFLIESEFVNGGASGPGFFGSRSFNGSLADSSGLGDVDADGVVEAIELGFCGAMATALLPGGVVPTRAAFSFSG